MDDAIIVVEHLTKKYGTFVAVDDISFTVKKNEIFGFLGPNGAGKTTTLEIIETLRGKTSGEVTVGGLSVDRDQNGIKQIIGVQLQKSGFYPMLRLTEILELFASLYGVSADVQALLKKVQLEDKSNNTVDQLSGGQRQRFSLATTIVNKPAIIFLDEPSTGLDPQARRNLWELIKSLKQDGTTVVLTTHFMDEAEYLCDRIAIIDVGKIIRLDSPTNLIDDLIARGFTKEVVNNQANLEDVFLDLTGKTLRE